MPGNSAWQVTSFRSERIPCHRLEAAAFPAAAAPPPCASFVGLVMRSRHAFGGLKES